MIYPNSHYVTTKDKIEKAITRIEEELEERVKYFKDNEKYVEAQRIAERTHFDIEMLRETGFCQGIENYSRHIAGRKEGTEPYTLFSYMPDDFVLVIDESHVTIPQVRAMYNGDRARKESLVNYGFRLPTALDNRPLNFTEFENKLNQAIFVSATPGDYELEHSSKITEQIIRPTGLLDPIIDVRPVSDQVFNITKEAEKIIEKGERVLITTLTKKMAEALTAYLKENGLKVEYLHSDIKTLERTEIIRNLRLGKFDILVGINLLREGLDIPEVSLVAILDADKEGFLRGDKALLQTIGRAARNANGRVIMYADNITRSMRKAIDETNRRREIQMAYNEEHGITPQTIIKGIRDSISAKKEVLPDESTELVQNANITDDNNTSYRSCQIKNTLLKIRFCVPSVPSSAYNTFSQNDVCIQRFFARRDDRITRFGAIIKFAGFYKRIIFIRFVARAAYRVEFFPNRRFDEIVFRNFHEDRVFFHVVERKKRENGFQHFAYAVPVHADKPARTRSGGIIAVDDRDFIAVPHFH